MVPVVTGCLAILVGVAPPSGLIDGFVDGMERFRVAILGLPSRPPRRIVNLNRSKPFKGQIWFAVAGVALILIALLNNAAR